MEFVMICCGSPRTLVQIINSGRTSQCLLCTWLIRQTFGHNRHSNTWILELTSSLAQFRPWRFVFKILLEEKEDEQDLGIHLQKKKLMPLRLALFLRSLLHLEAWMYLPFNVTISLLWWNINNTTWSLHLAEQEKQVIIGSGLTS